jgi:hypothetical protein
MRDSLASCAPVVYRRNRRVANPPQVSNLPHKRVLSCHTYEGFVEWACMSSFPPIWDCL